MIAPEVLSARFSGRSARRRHLGPKRITELMVVVEGVALTAMVVLAAMIATMGVLIIPKSLRNSHDKTAF